LEHALGLVTEGEPDVRASKVELVLAAVDLEAGRTIQVLSIEPSKVGGPSGAAKPWVGLEAALVVLDVSSAVVEGGSGMADDPVEGRGRGTVVVVVVIVRGWYWTMVAPVDVGRVVLATIGPLDLEELRACVRGKESLAKDVTPPRVVVRHRCFLPMVPPRGTLVDPAMLLLTVPLHTLLAPADVTTHPTLKAGIGSPELGERGGLVGRRIEGTEVFLGLVPEVQ
jgi:hypothetical protein